MVNTFGYPAGLLRKVRYAFSESVEVFFIIPRGSERHDYDNPWRPFWTS